MEEFYPVNNQYGVAGVLRNYSGYEKPIPAVVNYGIVFERERIFPGEADANVPAVMSWPEHRDEAWRNGTSKHIIPSCAPFLYALAMIGEIEERAGTLFMPAHSANWLDNNVDWRALARSLRNEGEVTVCLHIEDARRGRAAEFEKMGYRVVCCGMHEEPEFLYRLAVLMRKAARVLTNGSSSHPLYAVAAGVPTVTVTDRGPSPRYIGPATVEGYDGRELFGVTDDGYTPDEWRGLEDMARVFASRDPLTQEQREYAMHLLGADRFKTPEGLLADLEFAESLMARE